jgi:hypothetical protein
MTTPEQPATPPVEKTEKTARKPRQPKEPAIAPAIDPMAILAEILTKGNLQLNPETAEEKTAKLSLAKQEACHRQRVERIVLYAALVLIAVICPACLWVLMDDAKSMEKKAWAAPMLTLIVGGLMGFLTGRSQGKTSDK